MAVALSPIWVGQQFFSSAGNVLSGGKIQQYLAGTTTPQSTFTDNTGGTPNANPIILDSAGRYSNQIWFTQGVSYKLQLQDSTGAILLTEDNLKGVNDTSAGVASEWVAQGTPTFVSGTSFTVTGNQTSVFVAGVRVKAQINAGSVYATVSSSSFAAVTTVNLTNDSSSLDNTLSAVSVGLLGETNPSVPAIIPYNAVAFHAHLSANQISGSTLVFDTVDAQSGGTNYASGTGIFTAPFTGWYHFSTSAQVVNTSGIAQINVFNLQYNGATNASASGDAAQPTATTRDVASSSTFKMTAGDTMRVIGPTLAANNLVSGNTNSMFSGHLVQRTA